MGRLSPSGGPPLQHHHLILSQLLPDVAHQQRPARRLQLHCRVDAMVCRVERTHSHHEEKQGGVARPCAPLPGAQGKLGPFATYSYEAVA